MDSRILTRVAAVFVVAFVLTGAAAAAQPTIDTETTDTTTTSDITSGTTITGFEASPDNFTRVEASSLTADAKLEILDDNDQVVYTNTTPVATDSANGYYEFNVTHDELGYLPVESGGNETFTLRLYNDTTADNPDTLNTTFYVESVDGRTVLYVGDAYTADGGAFEDQFTAATELEFDVLDRTVSIPFASQTFAALDRDDVGINGSNSTVLVHYDATAAEDRVSDVAAELEDGTWAQSAILTVDGTPVKGYVGSAPDDVDSTDTYAVIDPETNDVRFELGEEFDGQSSVDVSADLNRGFVQQLQTYGLDTLGIESVDLPDVPFMFLTGGLGLSALAGGLLLARPRPDLEG